MASIGEEQSSPRTPFATRVQRLIDQGNARRVRITQGDKTVLEFPLTVGVIGGLLAPQAAAAGVIAAYLLGNNITVEPVEAGGETPGEPATVDGNRDIVGRFYEAMNRHDIDAVLGLWNASPVWHGPIIGNLRGHFALRMLLAQLLMAFPDFEQTIDDMIVDGDSVAVRVTSRGTHTGTLIGIAPTGRQFTMRSNTIFRIVNGAIAEEWEQSDMLGLLRQLGVLSPPGQSA
jgi:steroid delta-isomerase-like uncharacterized protein